MRNRLSDQCTTPVAGAESLAPDVCEAVDGVEQLLNALIRGRVTHRQRIMPYRWSSLHPFTSAAVTSAGP